ncbi:MAG: helix-turn-helix transcriptional regulator [Ideonella sp.]|nr:helix-turn-helix transcriptional regulator [Ideonella sp.]
MITNERQYQISKAQVAKFRAAIEAPDSSTRSLHPRAQKALREAAQSQLNDLAVEVADYERLRDGQLTAITIQPHQARIMRNWTQKELADKLAVAEQQVQRYEATQYKGVSFERLQAVADALKLRVREVITFEPL